MVTAGADRLLETLRRDGIAGLPGAFDRTWVARLGQELDALFRAALARPGGTVDRGRNRYYAAVPPQTLSGFADLVSHPWVTAVCAAVLGPGYAFVEAGFDTPLPGAVDQPWHRDFPAPVETWRDGELSSLAFNLTTVDVTPEMGPFEIAPGTHWDRGEDFEAGMFPPVGRWPGYAARAVRKLPRMGDVSVRSALAVHRGTANTSALPRPTLVLGVVSAAAVPSSGHRLVMTGDYLASLPAAVRPHLACRVVDALGPITQDHVIDGLRTGAAAAGSAAGGVHVPAQGGHEAHERHGVQQP